MRAVGAVLLLVALLLAGCGESTDRVDPRRGLTDDEIDWVADYADWVAGFGELLAEEASARGSVLGDEAGFARYADVTRELRACREGLEEQLADPPSTRLRSTLRAVRTMCDQITDAVEALVATTDAAARTGPFLDAGQAADRAYLSWTQIGADLDELTLARGSLPRGSVGSGSRIEPVLTDAAGRVADGRAVEVRCWSPPDWDRVLEEEGALTRGAMNVDTVGAFALPLTGTLHLQQEQCDALVRLAAGDVDLDEKDERHVVAFAVGTLSHEIQHIVAPTSNEAATECAGLQYNADVATELGVWPDEARRLALYYWQVIYPAEGDAYRTDDCRPGGPLDLAPETPDWPAG